MKTGLERKAMLGPKVRRLRRERGLTQSQMAKQLGISASYLNLIEHNQRPLTVPLLIKLTQTFQIDLQGFAEDDEGRAVAGLQEAFADPLFDGTDIKLHDIKELVAAAPGMARHVIRLYQAYRGRCEDLQSLAERVADGDRLEVMQSTNLPIDQVREMFHQQSNHFQELEAAAEDIWNDVPFVSGDLYRNLCDYLQRAHSVKVRVFPVDVMGTTVRRFDRHSRRILLSEMLPPSGRLFQVAFQIGLLQNRDLFDEVLIRAHLSSDAARRLARIGLANYFAGAVMMPYERFLKAAQDVRYDIQILGRRFESSFEQVCHRFTTLQRPGMKGVPFFMIRIDKAGNVSKRFSAAGFTFARFGGACPRWNVHDAFRTPGQIHIQIVQTPDSSTYFSLSRTVDKPGGGHRSPPQQFVVGLGCDTAFAGHLVYADGFDLENTEASTPIGINCRLCPRLDCGQRTYPPLNHRLIVEEHVRGQSPYLFAASSSGVVDQTR